jgi:rare lipoprotein A
VLETVRRPSFAPQTITCPRSLLAAARGGPYPAIITFKKSSTSPGRKFCLTVSSTASFGDPLPLDENLSFLRTAHVTCRTPRPPLGPQIFPGENAVQLVPIKLMREILIQPAIFTAWKTGKRSAQDGDQIVPCRLRESGEAGRFLHRVAPPLPMNDLLLDKRVPPSRHIRTRNGRRSTTGKKFHGNTGNYRMKFVQHAIVAAALASCALFSNVDIAHAADKSPAKAISGPASWYGDKFHGRRTANGERYDMHKLTAAHKTLPFGTKVRVTNRENGKSVVVRINDRGPFVGQRVIDLSRGAAAAVGMIQRGVAPVSIEIIS